MLPPDPSQAPDGQGQQAPRPPRDGSPVVIGLLGGIASGKSTVAEEFAHHGFAVVDADVVAREVVDDPAVLAQLAARFGQQILTAQGELDRSALAAIAFADPQQKAALEGITHPPIRARLLRDLAAHRAAGRNVILDVPLLLESGYLQHCDGTVFIATPESVREERARGRGWAPGERARRESHQASLEDKRVAATWVVENGADRGSISRQVAAITRDLGLSV